MKPYNLPDSVDLGNEIAATSAVIRRMTQSLAMAKEQELRNQSNGLPNLVDEAELLFKASSLILQQLKRKYRN